MADDISIWTKPRGVTTGWAFILLVLFLAAIVIAFWVYTHWVIALIATIAVLTAIVILIHALAVTPIDDPHG